MGTTEERVDEREGEPSEAAVELTVASRTPPYEGSEDGAIDLDSPAPPRPREPWTTVGVAPPEPDTGAGHPWARWAAWTAIAAAVVASIAVAGRMIRSEPAPAATPAPIHHGELTVESAPTGATVTLDGREVGTTPYAAPRLRTGGHSLRLALDGHEAIDAHVEIRADRRTEVSRQLYPADRTLRGIGQLHLTSDPPGAAVSFEGRSLGTTPIRGARLPAGIVALDLTTPDGRRHRRGVMIAADDTTSTHMDLTEPVAPLAE